MIRSSVFLLVFLRGSVCARRTPPKNGKSKGRRARSLSWRKACRKSVQAGWARLVGISIRCSQFRRCHCRRYNNATSRSKLSGRPALRSARTALTCPRFPVVYSIPHTPARGFGLRIISIGIVVLCNSTIVLDIGCGFAIQACEPNRRSLERLVFTGMHSGSAKYCRL